MPVSLVGAVLVGLLLPQLSRAQQYPVTDQARTDVVRPAKAKEKPPALVETTRAVVEALPRALPSAAATVAVGSAVVTATSAAAAITAASAATAATAAPGGLLGLLQSFVPFLAWRRRRPPWGRVVELGTNLPIQGAVVTVLDEVGKPRHTVQTRGDGTFGTFLPKGTYSLDVRKADYDLVKEKAPVTVFPGEQLYTGVPFTVASEETVVPIVVVLRPLTTRARRTTFAGDLRLWWERLRAFQSRFALSILFIGASINTVALVRRPTPILVGFEILYLVLFGVEILLSRVVRRALGRVRDLSRRGPVPLAIVRLVDATTRRIIATRVTSPQGQFLLMPPPGKYLLQVIHTAYVPYADENFRVGKGIAGTVRVTVDLEPKGSVPKASLQEAPE